MNVIVVNAGLGNPSSSRLLAERIVESLTPLGAEARIVDLRPFAHAITDAMLTGFPAPDLQAVLDDVVAVDALAVVTPVFQASYSGLFKSFMDLVEEGTLRDKPVLLAATGGSERHSLVIEHALRPLFAYLGADAVPTGVFAATGDFGAHGGELKDRIDKAAGQLARRLGVVGSHPAHEKQHVADVVPFADMLARVASGA